MKRLFIAIVTCGLLLSGCTSQSDPSTQSSVTVSDPTIQGNLSADKIENALKKLKDIKKDDTTTSSIEAVFGLMTLCLYSDFNDASELLQTTATSYYQGLSDQDKTNYPDQLALGQEMIDSLLKNEDTYRLQVASASLTDTWDAIKKEANFSERVESLMTILKNASSSEKKEDEEKKSEDQNTTANSSEIEEKKNTEETSSSAIEELVNDALDPCVAFHNGTAGASLKSIVASVSLLELANNAQFTTHKEDIKKAIQAYYDESLDQEGKETLKENYEMISENIESILLDPDELGGEIEDIDAVDTVKEILKNKNIAKNWSELNSMMADVIK